MEKKKDKSIKKKEEKKTRGTTKKAKKTVSEKMRDVIKGKKPLTRKQLFQFLSGVIDGTIRDDITKFEAGLQDKLKAAQLMFGEYEKDREEELRKEQENETQINMNRANDQLGHLIVLLKDRKVEGFNQVTQSEGVREDDVVQRENT